MKLGNAAAWAAIGLACLWGVSPALAQNAAAPAAAPDAADSLSIELNSVSAAPDNSCALTLLVVNRTGTDIAKSTYQIAIADTSGLVSLATFTFPALPSNKRPHALSFALPKTCDTIAGLFVNSVRECLDASNQPLTVCDEKYTESSKVSSIQFPWQP